MNIEETSPQSILVHVERFSLNKDLQLEAKEEFKEPVSYTHLTLPTNREV